MKQSILFIFFITINTCLNIYGQSEKTDSLIIVIKTAKDDTNKVKLLINLAWEYFNRDLSSAYKTSLKVIELSTKLNYTTGLTEGNNIAGNIYGNRAIFDSALMYFNQNIRICQKTKNKRGLSNTYNNIGIIYETKGNIDSSLIYYDKTLKIDIELGDKKSLSGTYFGIGNAYQAMGNYKVALDNFLKSLRLKEEVKDESGLSELYMSIGNLYYYQKKHKEALDYYNKSELIKIKLNDKYGLSGIYINLGNIYTDNKDSANAFLYLNKSLAISYEMKNEYYIGMIYNNMSKLYFDAGNLNKSLECSEKGLVLREKIGDKQGISFCMISKGNALASLNKYNESLECFKKAYSIGKEMNALEILKSSSEGLSKSYSKTKNFEQAYNFHVIFKQSCDSLQNEENTKKITQMEMQYDFDKKDQKSRFDQLQKDIVNKAELNQQKLLRNSFIIGFSLMLLLAVIIFRSYRQKKRDNIKLAEQKHEIQEKNEELNQQNEEIITQRDEIELQKNRIENIHSELTDSINYAKRIQQAVLPDMKLLLAAGNQYSVFGNQNSDYQIPNSDYFVLFKPKDVVSGDFYWANRINEWLIITVADCTGHGVPGAFMSMLGVSFLNEIVRKKEITKASEVLDQLRESIIEALQQKGESGEQKDGMDIALCAINMDTLEMQFAGANNPVYVIARAQPEAISTAQSDCFVPCNNEYNFVDSVSEFVEPVIELVEIKGDKQPIGIHSKMQPFTNQIYQLQKGDIIYLMSDGYEDQFGGPQRKKFLAKNLKNLLTAKSDKMSLPNCQQSMADQKQILETTLIQWIGTGEQIDDITVMGIRI